MKVNKLLSVDRLDLPKSKKENLVNDIYTIDLEREVAELTNEFCRYYYATDPNQKEYFAIIYNNDFIAPLQDIEYLSQNSLTGLNNVLDYSVVKLSSTQHEHFVVIVNHYNHEDNLQSFIDDKYIINLEETRYILNNIVNILATLENEDIYCCNIKPSNILMQNGKFLALREFINTYPNFYQEEQYIPLEMIECHKMTRFVPNTKHDIYALGVTLLQSYTSNAPWLNYKNLIYYNNARFEKSTLTCIIGSFKLSERLRVLFKWMLHDDPHLRWNLADIKEWLDKKNTQTSHDSITQNQNTISFNNQYYSNASSIAHALFNNWDKIKHFLKSNALFKWANREQLHNNDLAIIQAMVEDTLEPKDKNIYYLVKAMSFDEQVTLLLSTLNSNGPIRHEGFAISPYSIPCFLHYAAINKKQSIINNIIYTILDQSWSQYKSNRSSTGYLDNAYGELIQNVTKSAQTSQSSINIEKLVYTLNPNMICMSATTKGRYITTISELIIALNDIAEKNPKNLKMDKHLVEFISTKLKLNSHIRPVIFLKIPQLVNLPIINTLSVMNILQQSNPNIKMSNICKFIAFELKTLLGNYLHNVQFKKDIISKLDKVAKDGNFMKIINICNDQQKFINDGNGYQAALMQAKILQHKIKILRNKQSGFSNSVDLGQKFVVLISYVVCFVVTIIAII